MMNNFSLSYSQLASILGTLMYFIIYPTQARIFMNDTVRKEMGLFTCEGLNPKKPEYNEAIQRVGMAVLEKALGVKK